MELVNSQPHLFLAAKQHATEEPMNKSAQAAGGEVLRFDPKKKALKFLGLQANH